MLTVSDARDIVLHHAGRLPPETHSLGQESLGLILAEDVRSDLDMPPYDKALMDGYAVRCADLPSGKAELTVVEEIPAGQVPSLPLHRGQASRIMTGAPIPVGCDAVVIVEKCRT